MIKKLVTFMRKHIVRSILIAVSVFFVLISIGGNVFADLLLIGTVVTCLFPHTSKKSKKSTNSKGDILTTGVLPLIAPAFWRKMYITQSGKVYRLHDVQYGRVDDTTNMVLCTIPDKVPSWTQFIGITLISLKINEKVYYKDKDGKTNFTYKTKFFYVWNKDSDNVIDTIDMVSNVACDAIGAKRVTAIN